MKMIPGALEGYVELEGSPDIALEIQSASSVRKDTVLLRGLYWHAKVSEYWLVDARQEMPQFEILRWTSAGYVLSESKDGWIYSDVLGHWFQLYQEVDLLGQPRYVLTSRPA